MKRALLFCLLLVLITGCVIQEEISEQPVKDLVTRVSGELSESLQKLTGELGTNEYLMTPGSKVTIDGKLITMKEMTFDYDITFVIDGQEYMVSETNKPEILAGVEITVKKVSFDPEGKETYAITKIVKYTPGANEYLMFKDDIVKVGEKSIKLTEFNSDGSIYVRVESTEDRIREGDTKTIRDLKITNVKTNLRAITSEKYSILRIEE